MSTLPTVARAAENVRLIITPTTSSVDQVVHVRVSGLVPLELITLRAQQNRFGFPIASSAIFKANRAGSLDLSKDVPVSGDYAGADQMGLFWSMHLIGKPKFILSPEPELQLFDVTLSVVRGSAILATSTVRRYVVAPTTLHREINANGLVAAYFAPMDGRIHPGVIVLNGSDGGLQRDTAALLARHGFCALAVAYFGIGESPRYLSDIPIETVEHAVAFLRATPDVDASKIGVLGFSKGAELALVSASHFSAIKAVVAYAPSSAIFEGLGPSTKPKSSWTLRGKELPFANGAVPSVVQRKIADALAARMPVSYSPWYLAKLDGSAPGASIAVESIGGPIMLIAGGDDKLWPSAVMATRSATRLKAHHHPYADEILLYPKAGHAIEVPFVPTPHTISAGVLMLGGTPSANARADIDSWSRVLVFLKAHL
jgi:dienelactone hydrolase